MTVTAFLTKAAAKRIVRASTSPLGKTKVLAVVPSSDGSREYEIRRSKDGNVYCSCPAWKFQRRDLQDRTCKHIDALAAAIRRVA